MLQTMKKLSIIFLLAGLFTTPFWIGSCIDNDDIFEPPQLPPYTTEGKNTFGCLVNGEVLAVTNNTSKMQCSYYYSRTKPQLYGTFVIQGEGGREKKIVGTRIDTMVFDTGVYKIGFKKGSFEGVTIVQIRRTTINNYYCLENMYGWLHIKYIDTAKKIASGTFEFDAVNEKNDKDTIKIREGRFDAKFIY